MFLYLACMMMFICTFPTDIATKQSSKQQQCTLHYVHSRQTHVKKVKMQWQLPRGCPFIPLHHFTLTSCFTVNCMHFLFSKRYTHRNICILTKCFKIAYSFLPSFSSARLYCRYCIAVADYLFHLHPNDDEN